MMQSSTEQAYAGAVATAQLIDREDIWAELKDALGARDDSPVFYLTGPGGIGKTTLVRAFLQHVRERGSSQEYLAQQNVVDLYHPETHTIEGVCEALKRELRPGVGYFDGYEHERALLERAVDDRTGSYNVTQQRDRLAERFIQDFQRLTGDSRVILAFDTAEYLLYESEPIQDLEDIGQPGVQMREWLLETFLPQVGNVVVLIAGRPDPEQLRQDLREALGERLRERQIGPLDEGDTLNYFRAVAERARQCGADEAALRIETVPDEVRRVIHRYAGGRPILLSLVIDYLVIADRLLPALRTPLEVVQDYDEDTLTKVQGELEADIVRAIQETSRLADETIRYLAMTRRGLNASMLAEITSASVEQAQRQLEAVRSLSFVKVRRDDGRVFLQDEMYRLFERYVLGGLPRETLGTVYTRLISYYHQQIKFWRDRLRDLDKQTHPPLDDLAQARQELQNAIAERVHYELRRDAVRGFEAYYRAAEEAFEARHIAMDMQLREELLTWLTQNPPMKEWIADWALWDAGLRWVKRRIMRCEYQEARDIARELRMTQRQLMQKLGVAAETELDVWETLALVYVGEELDLAESQLRVSIERLEQHNPSTKFEEWHRCYLLAHAKHNLGYLLRTRGLFGEAVEWYRQAIPHWRDLAHEASASHANTLNNLAFALSEWGDYHDALRYCHDGLQIRQELGPRYPIALSYNTMAMIHVGHGHSHRAERAAERALDYFQLVLSQRGIGLAYRALAEALRRRLEVPYMYSAEEQEERLTRAEDYADQAVAIFSRDVEERSRLVESLIELGCVYRNWAKSLDAQDSATSAKRNGRADRATQTLERAVTEAGTEFPHLRLDALVNLAWHYYYMGDWERAQNVLHGRTFAGVDEYRITEEGGVPDESPITFFWVQLGKGHLLLGEIEMDAFAQLDTERGENWEAVAREHLQTAAEYYTLAIAYDQLFNNDFREMQRGLDLIYTRLRKLNTQQLKLMYSAVGDTATKYHMKPPFLHTFMRRMLGVSGQGSEAA